MKINNKIIIIAILILIGILFIVGIKFLANSNIVSDKSNIKIDKDIEGEYTGYQLELTSHYGGYGYTGQDLGSGTIIKTYNISDNDIFYEPISGGIWTLNLEQEKDVAHSYSLGPFVILKINKIGDENIELEYEDNKHIIQYNEEISIPSNFHANEGINYSYKIKFSQVDRKINQ